MPASVLAVVLLAALLHASWNFLVKTGGDKALDALFVALSASAVALPVALLLPAPARESWPWLAGSAAIHVLYFALLEHAYRDGHFGPSYTLMRGTAPLLVAVAGALAPRAEPVAARTWLGAAVVSAGLLGMALASRAPGGLPRRALGFALLNACVIAAYTLVDGSGVRRSGHAAAYTAWVFALDGPPLLAYVLATRGAQVPRYARARWRRGAVGGSFTVASYSLALWAMTRAPVAAVASVRETSVIFATLLGTWFLREPLGAGRVAAAAVVAAGVAILER